MNTCVRHSMLISQATLKERYFLLTCQEKVISIIILKEISVL